MEKKVSEYERKEKERRWILIQERELIECSGASRMFPNNEILKVARMVREGTVAKERRRFWKKYREYPTMEVEADHRCGGRWKITRESGYILIEYSGLYDPVFLMLWDYDLDDLIDYIEQFKEKEAGF